MKKRQLFIIFRVKKTLGFIKLSVKKKKVFQFLSPNDVDYDQSLFFQI